MELSFAAFNLFLILCGRGNYCHSLDRSFPFYFLVLSDERFVADFLSHAISLFLLTFGRVNHSWSKDLAFSCDFLSFTSQIFPAVERDRIFWVMPLTRKKEIGTRETSGIAFLNFEIRDREKK